MSVTTVEELTLHLPQDVIEMITRTAQERRQSFDQIVAEELRFALQPVQKEALQRLKKRLRQQQTESETEQRAHLNVRLSAREQARLSELLERNRESELSPEERAELQTLYDRIEAVATEKAAALWLLSGKTLEPLE